jgi:16S rRNA (guanine527-N7)-methyltransferase
MKPELRPDFASAAREFGYDLDTEALERFRSYRDAISDAAQRFSLTAVRDPSAIERRHFLESLALGRLLTDRGLLPESTRVLDIGSGAGLPGLPLKIARPDLQVSLLESNAKRCAFLREQAVELGLEGVEVLEGRAEPLAHEVRLRESFDLVVARAVAPLAVLLEYALPFLRIGGSLAATKGSGVLREVEEATPALDLLEGALSEVVPLAVAGLPAQSVVLVEKVAPTPPHLPRRAGIPSKRRLA